MKTKAITFWGIVLTMMFICAGCSSDISMPYSSDEYLSDEWTVEELISHFNSLGFSKVEVYGESAKKIGIYVENEDALFERFDKGDIIDISRKIGIYTEIDLAEPITIDNCPEFAEFIENGITSPSQEKKWLLFLESHDGEIIEFDGTISDWYDELFWIGVSFEIAVEDSPNMSYSSNTVSISDLGMDGKYHYENYHAGLINEGMRVHVITKIKKVDDKWNLVIDSMQVIE